MECVGNRRGYIAPFISIATFMNEWGKPAKSNKMIKNLHKLYVIKNFTSKKKNIKIIIFIPISIKYCKFWENKLYYLLLWQMNDMY